MNQQLLAKSAFLERKTQVFLSYPNFIHRQIQNCQNRHHYQNLLNNYLIRHQYKNLLNSNLIHHQYKNLQNLHLLHQ
jgi:hypothetical protein